MAEELFRIELDYTYDQFTVFFYGDRVFAGKKDYPIGQCCVDVMNLDESLLDEINRRVRLFIPVARKLPTEKTDSAAALAQERLNAVWELIFALPVYRDLKMDEACCFHTFRRLMAYKEKGAQVQDFRGISTSYTPADSTVLVSSPDTAVIYFPRRQRFPSFIPAASVRSMQYGTSIL